MRDEAEFLRPELDQLSLIILLNNFLLFSISVVREMVQVAHCLRTKVM